MKLQDFKKIDINDLKNLDFAKILEEILAKPDMAANAALVILSLFVMFQIFNGRQGEIKTLKGKLEQLEKKGAVIETYHATQKQFTAFISNLPKGVPEDTVIEKLTDFAANHDVQILSFSPAKMESKKFYDKVIVNLNIISKNYKNLCLFVNDIENSPYALRLERWGGFMEEAEKNNTPAIHAQITVASIIFKNEQK